MSDKRTMVIKGYDTSFFDNLDYVFFYYISFGKIARCCRALLRRLRLNFVVRVFYGRWNRFLHNASLVILFDSLVENSEEIVNYIKNVNPSIKVVFWYWNPVKSTDAMVLHNTNIDEIWTYNRFDAKKYGLKYNPQFYRQILVPDGSGVETDLVFLGKDKGRKQILEEICNGAKKQNLKCDFTIVENKKDRMKYEDYLKRVFKSKCIVDLVPNQKCGMTLRPLEALFYKKKLVTNYEDIVNYDFYNKENIFILGKDDINELADFVNSPYKEIDKKIVDFYSYEKWLERIKKR